MLAKEGRDWKQGRTDVHEGIKLESQCSLREIQLIDTFFAQSQPVTTNVKNFRESDKHG